METETIGTVESVEELPTDVEGYVVVIITHEAAQPPGAEVADAAQAGPAPETDGKAQVPVLAELTQAPPLPGITEMPLDLSGVTANPMELDAQAAAKTGWRLAS